MLLNAMMMPSEWTLAEIETKSKQIMENNTNNLAVLIETAGIKPAPSLQNLLNKIEKSKKHKLNFIYRN